MWAGRFKLVCLTAIPLVCQTQSVEMTATKLDRQGTLVRGSGGVKAKFGPVLVTSDSGTWDRSTGEVVLVNHVHVALPPRTDHNLFRYEDTGLVTAGPAEIFADRLTVKDMYLRGSGDVRVHTKKAKLPRTGSRCRSIAATRSYLVMRDRAARDPPGPEFFRRT